MFQSAKLQKRLKEFRKKKDEETRKKVEEALKRAEEADDGKAKEPPQ